MNMGPKVSMVKFSESRDSAHHVAPKAMPSWGVRSEVKLHMYYIGFMLTT
jgi:hypothetical protein